METEVIINNKFYEVCVARHRNQLSQLAVDEIVVIHDEIKNVIITRLALKR